ncbi:MAG: hypothetical protein JXB35_18260 [Anaerolineae bacterium]|nr:hypothetical protein [Anaerolineae bacterium]
MKANLKLPRKPSTVEVQILDDDAFTSSTSSPCVVCEQPYFYCSPYFWHENERIYEQDFHIEDRTLSDATLEQLSKPDSRIVHIRFPPAREESEIAFPWADDLAEGRISEFAIAVGCNLPTKRFLGNIAKPLHVDFRVQNFVSPEISATIETIKNGQTTTDGLSSLSMQGALICDGFASADYGDDTEVRITFTCTDRFGLALEKQISLHGRSILEFAQSCPGRVNLSDIDPLITVDQLLPRIPGMDIAKLEAAGHRLVEMGLLDLKAKLEAPDDLRPDLQPAVTDPATLLKAIRSDRILETAIDKTFDEVWGNRDMWLECFKHRSGGAEPGISRQGYFMSLD